MTDRWAVASTAWSLGSTWNGGTLPGPGDDVYANGFAVTIDQDITVASIRTTTGSGLAAGGTFTVSGGPRVINADVRAGGSTGYHGLIVSSAVTCTVNGNVYGGSTPSGNAHGINNTVAATINVTGNVTAGAGSAANHGISSANGTTLTVVGNVSASTSSNSNGIVLTGATTANVTITGTVTGSPSASSHGVYIVGAGPRVTINGAITGGGGAAANAYGVYNAVGVGVLRVNAELRWGTGGAAPIHGVKPMFVRSGPLLKVTSPSDDNWPLATGADISLVESGGGVDPKRFLNVGGVAVPIQ